MSGGLERLGSVLIATFVVGAVGIVLGSVLHWMAGPSFSPWTNYISDLSVGAGGAHIVFIVMIVGMAVLSGWFFLSAPGELEKLFGNSVGPAKAGRVFGVVNSLDLFVMVFIPLDPAKTAMYTGHIVTAVIAFVCMTGYMSAYGFAFRGKPGLFAAARVVAFLCALVALIVAILSTLTELLHILAPSPFAYLVEWIAFLLFAIWLLVTGIELRRAGRRT